MTGVTSALATGLLLCASLHSSEAKGAYQSGPLEGALYAGGLDATADSVYVTGVTYDHAEGKASSCFLSRFVSSKLESHTPTISSTVGDGTVMEACHGLSLLHDKKNPTGGDSHPFLVAGTSDPNGIYGSTKGNPSGFLMGLKPQGAFEFSIEAGLSMDDAGNTNTISYPVSVLYEYEAAKDGSSDIVDPQRQNGVAYIASVSATDFELNLRFEAEAEASQNQPNCLKHRKYGSSFELVVQRFNTRPQNQGTQIEHNWTQSFPIQIDETTGLKPDVSLAGMVMDHNQRFLIVAGSTRGTGDAYGNSEAGTSDEDGFISFLDPPNGQLSTSSRIDKNTIRIGTDKDDFILGICGDPRDARYFYVVGATGSSGEMGGPIEGPLFKRATNEGSLHGFIQKRERGQDEPIWAKEWKAIKKHPNDGTATATAGVSCLVTDDKSVYVAGIVENGAKVYKDHVGDHNGDDIMAMKFKGDTGEFQWITQFGSKDGSENLARSGALALDVEGNLIVYGDTTGSMWRDRKADGNTQSEIFLATLSSQDGTHDPMVGDEGFVAAQAPSMPPVLEEVSQQIEIGVGKGKDFPIVGKFNGFAWDETKLIDDEEVFHNPKGLGIQSGPYTLTEDIFSGGMVYNPDEDAAYLTGIAYEGGQANCRITKLSLSRQIFDGPDNRIGSNSVLETCNTLALHRFSEVVVVGSADQGSDILVGSDAANYPMAGFAMALNRNNLEQLDTIPLVTSQPQEKIQYPIDAISDGDDLYVISLTSTDAEFSREFNYMQKNNDGKYHPNWMNMEKYGNSVFMTVTKLTLSQEYIDSVPIGDITFTPKWTKEFPVEADENGSGVIPRVFLGGAIVKRSRGYLAIAGSTRGFGEGYGAAVGNDEDGFITLLDLGNGNLPTSVVQNNIREGTERDDIVLGICHDPADNDSFYIVGATKGRMGDSVNMNLKIPEGSQQAFLRKVDANDLKEVWTVQLGAVRKNSEEDNDSSFTTPTVAKAYDCVVKGNEVYVAGVVDDNARMVVGGLPVFTRGGDDVWLGKVLVDSGIVQWVRQTGSLGDDHIAPRGGLAFSKSGGVLVYGDTNGAYFRERPDSEKSSNLFLVEFEPNGRHKKHVRHHVNEPDAVPSPPANNIPSNNVPSPPVTPQLNIVNASDFDSSSKKKGVSIGAIIGILVAVVLLALLAAFYVLRSKRITKAAMTQPRDGIISSEKKKQFSDKTPPASSFLGGKAGMLFGGEEPMSGYEDNLKKTDTEVV